MKLSSKEKTFEHIKRKQDYSNILVNITRIVIILFVLIMVYNIFLVIYSQKTNKEAKFFLGFRAYVITTDSMKPKINIGDIIIIKEKKNLKKDDIITFKIKDENERVTHRIIDIKDEEERKYVTKGDNNKLEDEINLRFEDIEGKYIFKIPMLGRIFLKIYNIFYFLFLLLILCTVYLYQKKQIIKRNIRREKKKALDKKKQEEINKKKEAEKDKKEDEKLEKLLEELSENKEQSILKIKGRDEKK